METVRSQRIPFNVLPYLSPMRSDLMRSDLAQWYQNMEEWVLSSVANHVRTEYATSRFSALIKAGYCGNEKRDVFIKLIEHLDKIEPSPRLRQNGLQIVHLLKRELDDLVIGKISELSPSVAEIFVSRASMITFIHKIDS
jgi:hypothetical protein